MHLAGMHARAGLAPGPGPVRGSAWTRGHARRPGGVDAGESAAGASQPAPAPGVAAAPWSEPVQGAPYARPRLRGRLGVSTRAAAAARLASARFRSLNGPAAPADRPAARGWVALGEGGSSAPKAVRRTWRLNVGRPRQGRAAGGRGRAAAPPGASHVSFRGVGGGFLGKAPRPPPRASRPASCSRLGGARPRAPGPRLPPAWRRPRPRPGGRSLSDDRGPLPRMLPTWGRPGPRLPLGGGQDLAGCSLGGGLGLGCQVGGLLPLSFGELVAHALAGFGGFAVGGLGEG
jgi:hypothetical protein